MNKIVGRGPKNFIQQLEAERAKGRAVQDAKPNAKPDVDKAGGRAPVAAAARDALPGVPEKVAAKHGGAFKGAAVDLGRIHELKSAMVEWRQKQLGRVVDQFFKVLGQQLDLLPAEAREHAATKNVASMRALIESIGQSDLLVPSVAAAIGLFDSGVRLQARGKSAIDAEGAAQASEDASRAVLGLVEAIDGRTGQSSAINVYGPLVEQLELGYAKLSRADRKKIFERVQSFLAETAPRHGFDMTMTAELAELIAKHAAKHPGDAAKILDAARAEFAGAQQGALEQARAGLVDPPAHLPEGPAREAAAAIGRALDAILANSPAGPASLFAAVDQLRAAVNQLDAGRAPVAADAARVLQQLAKSPVAEEMISFLAQNLAAIPSLEKAAAAKDGRALAAAILEARDLQVEHPERLAELRPETALQVALAIGAGQDAGVLGALADFASSTTPDQPFQAYSELATRYASVARMLPQYPVLAPIKTELAAAIARAGKGPDVDAAQTQQLLAAMQQTKQYLPQADLTALIEPDGNRPSIMALADPGAKFANPPAAFLAELLAAASPHVQGNAELETSIARIAVEIARDAGLIHGGQQLHLRRMLADWTASVTDPKTLRFAARAEGGVAVRGRAQPSVAKFLEAHPELPLDFAFTAGQHLSSEQIAWAIDRVAKTRGRSTVRLLRDFVFGCIQAGRLDLVEAVRASKSPAKAISAVMTEVAQSYRNNQAAQVQFDPLIAGLGAGGDPIADLTKQKTAQALAALKLEELAGGKVEPRGVEEIMKIQANVADLLMQYSPGFRSELDGEVDMAALRPVFLESLKSVVQGTWPKPKYENEVGKRLMAALTPEQQKIWRENMVTPEAAPAAQGNAADHLSAVQLLRGLVQAIVKEAKLGGEGLPIGLDFSPRAAEELRKLRGELVEKLHASQKGSAEHKALSAKLGPVAAHLSVIELQLELARLVGAGNVADARGVLLEIKPRLETAIPALRKLRARGSAEAVQRVLDVAGEIKSSPRQGRYAADEDGLTHMIDSHKSGCLSFGDRRRRWGMAGALADANIKMLRAYNDDRQVYRAFLKFFPIEAHGYKGPALWVDGPVADGGGGHADLQVLYKHIFNKARAMGVPVYGYLQNAPADFTQRNGAMTIFVDDGNTGIMHSDSMFPGGKGSIRQMRGNNPTWNMAANWPIYFPPNIQPR